MVDCLSPMQFTEEVAPPPGLTGAPRKPVVKVEKTEKPAKVHTDFCAEDLKSNLDARAEEVLPPSDMFRQVTMPAVKDCQFLNQLLQFILVDFA